MAALHPIRAVSIQYVLAFTRYNPAFAISGNWGQGDDGTV
jgi:hypothetical protein